MSELEVLVVPCPRCAGKGTVEKVDPGALREVRIAAGLSLRRLGEMIGVSAMYLCDIESGNRAATERIIAGYRGLVR